MTIPKPIMSITVTKKRTKRAPLLASTTGSGASSIVSMRSPNQGVFLYPTPMSVQRRRLASVLKRIEPCLEEESDDR